MIYTGIVEDRSSDPLKLGRCKVRVFGLHSPDKVELPTSELPWAVVMQPVNSAANSGIGFSPTGLVEGTMVIVMFNDEHQQLPIIIGTVAGIPSEYIDQPVPKLTTTEAKAWTDSSGNVIRDGSGNPITTSETTEVPTIKPPSVLTISQAGYEFIKNNESLSSIEPGKNKYISYKAASKLPGNTKIYAYQDSKGIWTIGYGNTFLSNGSAVTENTVITLDEADALFKSKVDTEFVPAVKGSLSAPVTQSMFDAMVDLAYNGGTGAWKKSDVLASVNATNYEEAASLITQYRTGGLSGLIARRDRTKTFFGSEGYPEKDMSSIKPSADTKSKTPDDASQNPVVTVKPPVKDTLSARSTQGFRDPNGVYPKIVNEPDTHRLARHEKIDQTVVYVKEQARVKNVTSGGSSTWSQPNIPYNTKYPYNQVRVTESGHVQEFDDTPNNERIHTYHRSGTYEEIDRNGTRVSRIVGDDFEILERNGHVLIKGSLNVTILGNSNVRIENDSNIDVLGNVNLTVGGDMMSGVTGKYHIKCVGEFAVDASKIHLNGDVSTAPTGKGTATGVPSFSTLTVPTRNTEIIAQYETPTDGDPAAYDKQLEAAGIPAEETTTTKQEAAAVPEKTPDPIVKDCSMIPSDGNVDRGFKLSASYKLSDLDPHNGINSPAVSISKAELVCNLKMLAENCLEPIKALYPSAMITSGFRNFIPSGGSTTSDHLWGCAADIVIGGFDRQGHYTAIQEIAKRLPAWTQLILEYKGNTTVWIHVAYNQKRGLKMDKFTMNNNKTYQPFGTYTLLT